MAVDLPEELIQRIFCFLNPCEILRLRQVSKRFRDITQDATLWRELYANARLLLPPGPFPSQSTQYLERTLVQSEHVSKTWTSQPARILRSRCVKINLKNCRAICQAGVGRWYIFLEEKTIQCYNVDTGNRHLLYDGSAHPGFWFSTFTTSHTNNRWLYLLLVGEDMKKLLEFRINDDSFSEPEIMDWARPGLHSFDMLSSKDEFYGSTPFITARHNQLPAVFDLRTRRWYEPAIPPSKLENELQSQTLAPRLILMAAVVPARTHIIAVQKDVSGMPSDILGVNTLVQAFVVPDSMESSGNEVGKLRMTHEAVIRTTGHTFTLLRNSTVDPITGSVNIRLLEDTTSSATIGKENQMSCLDLTLPEPTASTDVLPISARSQCLIHSTWSSGQRMISDNRHVRGLLMTKSRSEYRTVVEERHTVTVQKFTIDACGEECTAVLSDPCLVELPRAAYGAAFDNMRGSIQYYKPLVDASRVTIVDLA